jgi:hypothetical protein
METNKTHWKVYHNPDYIGAYAFQPNERKILTIKGVRQETIKSQRGSEDCLVVHFKEKEKPLICNVTNSKAIEKVAGSGYIEDWPGTVIELYVTEVPAFGDTVEAVRVMPKKPKITKPALTPEHPAYVKVVEAVKTGFTREQVEQKYTVSNDVWEGINGKS